MSMFTPMTWNKRPARWLIITAVLELFLATIFVVLGLAIREARGGMLMTGVILGVVGIGLLVWGAKMNAGLKDAERLKTVGLQGTARVAGFTQTGMTMNDNPMIEMDLDVTIPGRQTYRVNHKEWVPLSLLGALGMGASFPVRVDPADPTKVLIEWDQGGTLGMPPGINLPGVTTSQTVTTTGDPTAALGALGGMLGAAALGGLAAAQAGGGQVVSQTSMNVNLSDYQAEAERLKTSGVSGMATITALQDTGVALQGQRLFMVDVVVNVPGKPPAVTKAPALVPEASAAKMTQGATLPVSADALDPKKFAFSW